jgi:hypothetical protein
LIPPVGEPVPGGEPVPVVEPVPVDEPVALEEAVPADEAVQAGEAVPADEAVQAGEAVPVDGETGTEGVGVVSVGEGVGVVSVGEGVGVVSVGEGLGVVSVGEGLGVVSVGEGVGVVSPWIDGGDDCPTTAAASLGPCSWRWPADRNLNTADLCGYSLRGTCEIASTETKRATLSGECLGRSGWIRPTIPVMAPATAPSVRMTGIGRFHHGTGGGLAG